jgi:hypothetical protein
MTTGTITQKQGCSGNNGECVNNSGKSCCKGKDENCDCKKPSIQIDKDVQPQKRIKTSNISCPNCTPEVQNVTASCGCNIFFACNTCGWKSNNFNEIRFNNS